MDNFIKSFTASQIRGAAIGNAVCNPFVSFLTNPKCQPLTLSHAMTDGIISAVCICLIVSMGSQMVFRAGCRKNPWFRVEDHPLGEVPGIMRYLPVSQAGMGAVFALLAGAAAALLLYLIYTLFNVESVHFGTFLIFKAIFSTLLGALVARYSAMNNFR